MNILVTGANGQLGREMRIVAENSNDNYVFTDIVEVDGLSTVNLDITDIEAIRTIVKDCAINCIINCAAFTNVDAAENNETLAEVLNSEAPKNLAIAMKEVCGLLLHISTDYVFGGNTYNIPCQEDQKGTPTGVYGFSKLRGEENIISIGCNHVIIRTAWLYSEFGKNFVKTMLNLTATKSQLKVVFDQVGTPTYAYDLAVVVRVIIEDYKNSANSWGKGGIYHFSNEGVCSWFDFAKMIVEYAGNTACDIQPSHSYEFPSPVKRPAFSVLDKTKIKDTFDIKIPYWTASLKRCMLNMGVIK